ncbi:hypothetical protein EV193_10515 [Herbihabitans rhizosphaerae]|uniref:Uncharacterized protein n=1 Tax=Herbihabitans rhizosphaerae TaxID=1872711 RepID=A0A4Q7KP63_9PSEU|nr:hypothetical protein [Herbihabitans rhizosphaerae]RZS37461.1 hypothetical protein EV193_10515 [Herbihabitans rhizosphaerae]
MIDMHDLKATLDDRAGRAPDPDEVLAGAMTLVDRRRKRRTAIGAAAAAVMTSGALITGVAVLRGDLRDGGYVSPAGPPGPAQPTTSRPWLPFSVGWMPQGYQLVRWHTGPRGAGLEYGAGPGSAGISARLDNVDKSVGEPVTPNGEQVPVDINGASGTLIRDTEFHRVAIYWQWAPGQRAVVYGKNPVAENTLLAVARSLTRQQSKPAGPTPVVTVPAAYPHVEVWSNGELDGGAQVSLCDHPMFDPNTQPSNSICVYVTVGGGPPPSRVLAHTPEVPEQWLTEETTHAGIPMRTTKERYGVLRVLDPGHWVTVALVGKRGMIDTTLPFGRAVLLDLAASVKIG